MSDRPPADGEPTSLQYTPSDQYRQSSDAPDLAAHSAVAYPRHVEEVEIDWKIRLARGFIFATMWSGFFSLLLAIMGVLLSFGRIEFRGANLSPIAWINLSSFVFGFLFGLSSNNPKPPQAVIAIIASVFSGITFAGFVLNIVWRLTGWYAGNVFTGLYTQLAIVPAYVVAVAFTLRWLRRRLTSTDPLHRF